MRVLLQLAIPRMQDGQNPRQRSQMTFDRTEFLHGLGRHTHQQAIHQLLVTPEHAAQFRRDGRHGVIIVTRQQLGLPFGEPLLGLLGMTLRAGPIAATVIDPEGLRTVVASVPSPTELFGAAGLDIGQTLRRPLRKMNGGDS